MSLRATLQLIAATAAVVCLGAACDRNAAPERIATARRLSSTLCEAARRAGTGQTPDARALFEDAHAELHTFADELSRSERDDAARVLRAKQRVEMSLQAGDPQPDELVERLTTLSEAIAAAGPLDGEPCSDRRD